MDHTWTSDLNAAYRYPSYAQQYGQGAADYYWYYYGQSPYAQQSYQGYASSLTPAAAPPASAPAPAHAAAQQCDAAVSAAAPEDAAATAAAAAVTAASPVTDIVDEEVVQHDAQPSGSQGAAAAGCTQCARLLAKFQKYGETLKFLMAEHEGQLQRLLEEKRRAEAELQSLRRQLGGAEQQSACEPAGAGGGPSPIQAGEAGAEGVQTPRQHQPAQQQGVDQQQLATLEAEAAALRQREVELGQRCQRESAAAEQARQMAAAVKAQCRQAEVTLAKKMAELKEAKEREAYLSGQVDSLTKDVDEMDQTRQEALARAAAAEERQRAAQVEADKARFELQTAQNLANYLRSQVKQRDEQVEGLSARVRELEVEQSRLPGEVAALREELEAEQQRAQRAQHELSAAQRELGEVQGKPEARDEALRQAAASMEALQVEKADQEGRRASTMAQLQQDMKQLQSLLKSQRAQQAESAAGQRQLEQQLAEAQAALKAQEGALWGLQALRQRAEPAEGEAARMQARLDLVNTELPVLRANVAAMLTAQGRGSSAVGGAAAGAAGGLGGGQQGAALSAAERRELEELRTKYEEMVGVVAELQSHLVGREPAAPSTQWPALQLAAPLPLEQAQQAEHAALQQPGHLPASPALGSVLTTASHFSALPAQQSPHAGQVPAGPLGPMQRLRQHMQSPQGLPGSPLAPVSPLHEHQQPAQQGATPPWQQQAQQAVMPPWQQQAQHGATPPWQQQGVVPPWQQEAYQGGMPLEVAWDQQATQAQQQGTKRVRPD